MKQLGCRAGNWLNQDQARLLLEKANGQSLRHIRDFAMISILLGCGLRRAELSALRREDIQIRQGHWAIVDLGRQGQSRPDRTHANVGEGSRGQVADALHQLRRVTCSEQSAVTEPPGEPAFPRTWSGMSSASCARRLELDHLAPHDLRRTCAKLCHVNGGELEQIQFLLGHASVLTTERYLGCKQNLEEPVNDRFGCLFSKNLDS